MNSFWNSEVGPIPEGWECNRLDHYTSFISYGFTNPMPTTLNGPYMVTAADISGGRVQYEGARRTSRSAFDRDLTAKSRPKPNDLLLTKDGALGRVALVGDEELCINQSVAILRPNTKIHPQFFAHLLQASKYQDKMLEDAGGTTIKHIYITIVNKMPIAVPSCLKEQEAIAEALSDADALIEGLERLIAKKRLIKQGAMQDLLTAKRRLPGFSGEWGRSEIGEVCTISMAASKSGKLTTGGKYLVCDMGAVGRDGSLIAKKTVDDTRDLLKRGDLVMPKDDIGGGQIIGKAALVPSDDCYVLGDHVYGLRPQKGDPSFIALAINSFAVNAEIRKKVVGSAQLGLGRNSVMTQIIPWPNETEQKAISAILLDMEAEIQALDSRLEKARQVKEGMMQNLLTGRIRLV